MRMQGKRKIKFWRLQRVLFLSPSLLGVSFFILLPFANVILSSFRNVLSGRFAGLRNYSAVFQNVAFRLAAGNTVRFIATGIPQIHMKKLCVASIYVYLD